MLSATQSSHKRSSTEYQSALAKANQGGPSLNDSLETGPPLQNLL